jgi:hypothetical protein
LNQTWGLLKFDPDPDPTPFAAVVSPFGMRVSISGFGFPWWRCNHDSGRWEGTRIILESWFHMVLVKYDEISLLKVPFWWIWVLVKMEEEGRKKKNKRKYRERRGKKRGMKELQGQYCHFAHFIFH